VLISDEADPGVVDKDDDPDPADEAEDDSGMKDVAGMDDVDEVDEDNEGALEATAEAGPMDAAEPRGVGDPDKSSDELRFNLEPDDNDTGTDADDDADEGVKASISAFVKSSAFAGTDSDVGARSSCSVRPNIDWDRGMTCRVGASGERERTGSVSDRDGLAAL
jgi:hypothetical protein